MLDHQFRPTVVELEVGPHDDKTGHDTERGNTTTKGGFLVVDIRLQGRRAANAACTNIDDLNPHRAGDRNLSMEVEVDFSRGQHDGPACRKKIAAMFGSLEACVANWEKAACWGKIEKPGNRGRQNSWVGQS